MAVSKFIRRSLFAALISLGFSISPASAAMLNVDMGGNLLGATGVDINGTLYDVEFIDDSCPNIFDNCDEDSDFDFTTLADALLASQALLDQVFIDGVLGNFDSMPQLTSGCVLDQRDVCVVFTPYAMEQPLQDPVSPLDSYRIAAANNFGVFFGPDIVNSGPSLRLFDFSLNPTVTLARWTPSMPAVPVPAAVWLFGSALIGMLGFSWRKTAV